MILRYSIRFFLHNRGEANKNKRLPLRMRITLRSQKPFDIPMQISLLPEEFDPTSQCVVGSSRESKEARLLIAQWSDMTQDIMNRYELIEKRIPEAKEVKALILDTLGRKPLEQSSSMSPERAWDEYIKEYVSLHTWSEGTLKKQKTNRRHFLESCKAADMHQIDERDISNFVAHLTNMGMHNTTIKKGFRIVRQWLLWCGKKGYCDTSFLDKVDLRLKDSSGGSSDIVYLTLDELRSVENLKLSNPVLEHVRDVFVFCCYTGLRFSDAYALTRGDVSGKSILTVTQKTTDPLTIELNSHAKAILDKYSRVAYDKQKALPVYTNQETNRKLKEIGIRARLDRKIHFVYHNGSERHDEWKELRQCLTTHCARRTFVVTGLTLGIPAPVIMRWTGHKNYESMKPYIDIVESLKQSEMSKFDKI